MGRQNVEKKGRESPRIELIARLCIPKEKGVGHKGGMEERHLCCLSMKKGQQKTGSQISDILKKATSRHWMQSLV